MSRPCLCSLDFNLEYGPGYVFDTVLVLKLQQLHCNCLLAPLPSLGLVPPVYQPLWGLIRDLLSLANLPSYLLCEVTI